MPGPIYLDNNATTRPLPPVIAAVSEAMGAKYGNPSSPNTRGSIAQTVLVSARQEVAELLGADEEGVVFTAGGTEANNLALQSFWQLHGAAGRIITTPVEHSSVLAPSRHLAAQGCGLATLGVDAGGRVDPQELVALLDANPDWPTLTAVQWANSEIGAIQPIAEIAEICHEREVPLLVDAAQAVGRLPIDMESLPIDFVSFTAHKFHGPQGVGALCCADRGLLRPLLHGGDQQHGLRAGTENLPGLAGLAAAARLRRLGFKAAVKKLGQLRDAFEKALLQEDEGISVNGDPANRVAQHLEPALRRRGRPGDAGAARRGRRAVLNGVSVHERAAGALARAAGDRAQRAGGLRQPAVLLRHRQQPRPGAGGGGPGGRKL